MLLLVVGGRVFGCHAALEEFGRCVGWAEGGLVGGSDGDCRAAGVGCVAEVGLQSTSDGVVRVRHVAFEHARALIYTQRGDTGAGAPGGDLGHIVEQLL